MSTHRKLLQFLSVIVILSMLFSGFSLPTASAQGESGGIKRQHNAQTGKVSLIGPENGRVVSAAKALGISPSARPADPGLALAKRFGPEFGLRNPARDLKERKTRQADNGRMTVRYQQAYQGIPVLGGELVVNTNEKGDLYSISGEISPDLSLPTQPTIDPEQARQTALQEAAQWYQGTPEDFRASEPELWIFDESLLRPSARPVELVWRLEVTSKDIGMPVRELVLVNAQRGSISLHFNQIDTAWSRDGRTTNSTIDPMPALAGVNWYVASAPTGSDTNSCTTPASPCANIQKAISLASNGDVIYVADGTYHHPGPSLNPTANVVVLNKNLVLSGGWKNNFSNQTGISVIDGQGTNNGIYVNAPGNTAVDHFLVQNSTAATGGAIYVSSPAFTLSNSALYQNSAADYGAGMFGTNNAHITIINSTIGNNIAPAEGAIYADSGTIDIADSTVVFNSDGLVTNSTNGQISMRNSIVWGNSSSDCSGAVTSLGYNIRSDYGCSANDGIRDQYDIDPQVGTFVASGGYYPLLLGSPAIDMGPWDCSPFDQRGVARPQDALCDVGAYEYESNRDVNHLLIRTYDAGNSWDLPGTLVCDQTDLDCLAGDEQEQAAHQYAVGTYNLYKNSHNRNSIDGNGLELISSVHYGDNYPNAFWNGYMMVYGDGYSYPLADDVVAHELTHGVTQYESNLFYYYQSGAINESFSDVWGEYYDQGNYSGTDTDLVKWEIGEDTGDPSLQRSMEDPGVYGDPDRMLSPNYYFTADDFGGVHHNSGINNKAVYLMVQGDTFNGKTVSSIGWAKTIAIYYKANADLLTSGADYSDLYYALQQACSDLIGGTITAGDCAQVKNALDAVEMNADLTDFNFNIEAPVCNPGEMLTPTFSDDLESGTGNWTFTNGDYPRWKLDSSYGAYAHSRSHSLYADDYPATATDARAQLVPIAIPSRAYLRFAHAYDFDSLVYNSDGGILEYSSDGGSTWADARPLMDSNWYNGTIDTGTGNPLAGHSAFVDSSHGYISTRLNLVSLAGQTVTFRWRMGLNAGGYSGGWWVDDVKVYQCTPVTGIFDDRNTNWTFSTGWNLYNGAGPYSNTSRYTNVVGSQTQFTFSGNKFNFTYVKASNRGLIDVYVDGTKIAQVNAKGSTTAWRQIWTSPALTPGLHTARFVHAGANGTYIDVDAIEIFSPTDLVAPAAISNLAASTGTTTGAVDLSWTAPGDDGSTGTVTSYLIRYNTSAITSDNWDAATPVTTGLPTLPVAAGNPQTMTVSGLTLGATYFFAVRAQDEDGNLGGISNSPSAAAQTLVPAPAGIYDDTDINWVYTGPWTQYNSTGPYNNTSHYTNVVGSQAQLTFSGNKFTFTYVKASNRGLIDVYVDGGKIAQINAKGTSIAWQQTWTSPTLALGEHIVRFVHAGASGTYIDVDKIQIFAPTDLVAPAAIDDLAASTGTTTGAVDLSWTAPGDDGSTGTATSYLVRYSTLAITSGNWNAATPVTTGLPAPLLAGSPQTMTVSGLTPGTTYFFAVRAQDEDGNLGGVSNSVSAAAQTLVPVPAGTYDDTDVNWVYIGSWAPYNGGGPANNTSHYTSTVGNEAQFSFNGNKFTFTYVKAANRGLIDVYVDGVKVIQINAKSTSTTWQASWTSPALTAGVHAVRFVHAGGGTYIDVDKIQIIAPPTPVPAGPYDDNHAAWTFSSGWTTYSGAGPLNNTNHYTNVVGSEAQLTFTGTGFTFTYVKASNRGLIDVYVDGVKVTQLNARNSSTLWQQTWTHSGLASGTHTVRFVNAGGGYIDVDSITILP